MHSSPQHITHPTDTTPPPSTTSWLAASPPPMSPLDGITTHANDTRHTQRWAHITTNANENHNVLRWTTNHGWKGWRWQHNDNKAMLLPKIPVLESFLWKSADSGHVPEKIWSLQWGGSTCGLFSNMPDTCICACDVDWKRLQFLWTETTRFLPIYCILSMYIMVISFMFGFAAFGMCQRGHQQNQASPANYIRSQVTSVLQGLNNIFI